MKFSKIYIAFFIAVVCFSCKKDDDFNYPEGTVGISKITNFPVFNMKGDTYVIVPKNGTYSEAGVTATENGQSITVTTTGTVNTATPGIYLLTYSAVNKDGFSKSVNRWVAVYSTDATAAANDLSGTYLRAATGAVATWTKLAPGVYLVNNPGGAASGYGLDVVAFNSTGNTVKIPNQVSSDGNITYSTEETYTPATATAAATYTWKIMNPGYGTSARTFVKQ